MRSRGLVNSLWTVVNHREKPLPVENSLPAIRARHLSVHIPFVSLCTLLWISKCLFRLCCGSIYDRSAFGSGFDEPGGYRSVIDYLKNFGTYYCHDCHYGTISISAGICSESLRFSNALQCSGGKVCCFHGGSSATTSAE